MAKGKKMAVISNQCVACGTCIDFCPVCAITISDGIRAKVGQNCVGCGKCAVACPASVIRICAGEALA